MIVAEPVTIDVQEAPSGTARGSGMTPIARQWGICVFHQFAGPQPVTLDGQEFEVERTARLVIDGVESDVLLFKIAGEFPFWARLYRGALVDYDDEPEVLLAGAGRHSTTIPGSYADGQPGWSYSGLKYATATIESPAIVANQPFGEDEGDLGPEENFVGALRWRFRSPGDGGLASEGLPATNDSGGSVFIQVGGEWQALGIIGGGGAYTNAGVPDSYKYWDTTNKIGGAAWQIGLEQGLVDAVLFGGIPANFRGVNFTGRTFRTRALAAASEAAAVGGGAGVPGRTLTDRRGGRVRGLLAERGRA